MPFPSTLKCCYITEDRICVDQLHSIVLALSCSLLRVTMCDYMQTVMHLGEAATVDDGELIADLFGAVGKVWKMDEKLSDAAGAVGYVHVLL